VTVTADAAAVTLGTIDGTQVLEATAAHAFAGEIPAEHLAHAGAGLDVALVPARVADAGLARARVDGVALDELAGRNRSSLLNSPARRELIVAVTRSSAIIESTSWPDPSNTPVMCPASALRTCATVQLF
jgi:hypothetical protein